MALLREIRSNFGIHKCLHCLQCCVVKSLQVLYILFCRLSDHMFYKQIKTQIWTEVFLYIVKHFTARPQWDSSLANLDFPHPRFINNTIESLNNTLHRTIILYQHIKENRCAVGWYQLIETYIMKSSEAVSERCWLNGALLQSNRVSENELTALW